MLRALVVLVALTLGWEAHAVEYGPGRRYDAGQRVEVSGIGLSFQIPAVWLGALVDGAFVLGSETEAGALLLLPNMSRSRSEIRAWFRDPMPLDDTTVLVPVGEPVVSGDRFQLAYRVVMNGAETQEAFAFVQGSIGSNGQVLTVAAIGASKDKKALVARQDELLGSVRFSVPQRPPELVGCWLNTDSSYTDGLSFTSSTRIVLDAAGNYQYTEKSMSSYSGVDSMGDWSGDSSVESGDGERGTYHTIGSQLFLVDPKGEYRELSFEMKNGSMVFNGARYGGC